MAKGPHQGTDRFLVSARKLFRLKGFHQTSMTELSSLAGISVGQIYRLFRNKEDVIAAIVQHDTQMLTTHLKAIHEAVVCETISVRDAFKAAVLDTFKHGNDALTFEILAEASRSEVVNVEIGVLLNQYRMILRKLILAAECEIKGTRLYVAEDMVMALLLGLGSRTLRRASSADEEVSDNAADMILAMLCE